MCLLPSREFSVANQTNCGGNRNSPGMEGVEWGQHHPTALKGRCRASRLVTEEGMLATWERGSSERGAALSQGQQETNGVEQGIRPEDAIFLFCSAQWGWLRRHYIADPKKHMNNPE